MVLFGVTAQILDTILVKGAIITAEGAFSIITWSMTSVYRWYCPAPLTETQRLQIQIQQLQETVKRIENPPILHIENTDGHNYILID